ncbi:hypothetical protein E3E12_05050 [Formicincola oecophyllae]|uniref:Uncharacterized protein n=1 Tax=Formicincola oecophyllae TaxID=2558361 RepID=A0A4Y6U9G1_9PROT|nr:hypothetical protein [Formicincola oecophyllae]QDH13660.1 hypothetical protein E3E12_05050 [Formicincola oecophyllae]
MVEARAPLGEEGWPVYDLAQYPYKAVWLLAPRHAHPQAPLALFPINHEPSLTQREEDDLYHLLQAITVERTLESQRNRPEAIGFRLTTTRWGAVVVRPRYR